ncbi:hypothetical protein M406DRAFT_67820 [Cryphonectria parasitica EP155]|uniref:Uncharacterized protein n=1 Tax=Cryphonectria parasitica (strain ATCC 38755 / EP155) TaxID=660469 RepID=A0A9P5CPV2_CRYP1|nr:uncharacterized protein M406DRAFT_67820 [Cryphonectria parasitica EP155]KAF3765365.1 hypothetical protein M406DRAFT_67820 [Cryphonectria parasitica EP155]
MYNLTTAFAIMAMLGSLAGAKNDFTTVTRNTAVPTGVPNNNIKRADSEYCTRLSQCVWTADESDIPSQDWAPEPIGPIVFDSITNREPTHSQRCMEVCQEKWSKWSMPGNTQNCCDFCDSLLSCCRGHPGRWFPEECHSDTHMLPFDFNVSSPNPGPDVISEPSPTSFEDEEEERPFKYELVEMWEAWAKEGGNQLSDEGSTK